MVRVVVACNIIEEEAALPRCDCCSAGNLCSHCCFRDTTMKVEHHTIASIMHEFHYYRFILAYSESTCSQVGFSTGAGALAGEPAFASASRRCPSLRLCMRRFFHHSYNQPPLEMGAFVFPLLLYCYKGSLDECHWWPVLL